MSQYATRADVEVFAASRVLFETLVGSWLVRTVPGPRMELEDMLTVRSREFRQLMQDHLDLRAQREPRLREVADAEQVARGAVETGRTRR